MTVNRDIFLQYMGLPSRSPLGIEITRAGGIYLFGPNGEKYIDLVSGVAVSNLGHNNSQIIKAVKDQAEKHMHLMVYGEMVQAPQTLLAERLVGQLNSHLNAIYFVSTGSEAIEGALKLAKRYTGRNEIIAFRNAYHGGTHGALSILGNENLKNSFRPLLPEIRHLDFNDIGMLDQITNKTACVVVETIQAEAGIIIADPDFLNKLEARCKENAALLIIDDIQMGMGRTGRLFSFEHYDIAPDILVLAKALGAGMPLGAFISSRKIMDSFTFNPELGHITTFGGHPVSCAAANAGLDLLLNSGLLEQVEEKGKRFEEIISEIKSVKEIRRKGLMMAIDLGDEEKLNAAMEKLFSARLITDRFLFNNTSFRIAPPLTISPDEITEICKLIVNCL